MELQRPRLRAIPHQPGKEFGIQQPTATKKCAGQKKPPLPKLPPQRAIPPKSRSNAAVATDRVHLIICCGILCSSPMYCDKQPFWQWRRMCWCADEILQRTKSRRNIKATVFLLFRRTLVILKSSIIFLHSRKSNFRYSAPSPAKFPKILPFCSRTDFKQHHNTAFNFVLTFTLFDYLQQTIPPARSAPDY